MKIALVNESRLVSAADAAAIAAIVDAQLHQDFCPAWSLAPSSMTYFVDARHVPAGFCVMAMRDTIDDPNALGYHTENGGVVASLIGTHVVLNAGGAPLLPATLDAPSVCSVVSHEACEMVLDPSCNLWVDGPGRQYSYEACDPVESDSYMVAAGAGARGSVSNFILPDWCDPQKVSGGRYDFMGRLHGPFAMTKGGYLIVREAGKAERAIYGDLFPHWRRVKKEGETSRSSRRLGKK